MPLKIGLQPKLDQRALHQLQRINIQSMKKYKFHQEKNLHMSEIIRKQKHSNFESEYDKLQGATIKGPLAAESYNRLQQLKAMLNK